MTATDTAARTTAADQDVPIAPWRTRATALTPPAVAFVIGLGLWQLFVALDLGRVELPGPLAIAGAIVEFGRTREFFDAALSSGQVFLQGTIAGALAGVAVGVAIGANRMLDRALGPLLFAVYSTPFIALVPLFLVAFGYGVLSKSMIVFFLVFMTVVLQTIAGVRNIDPRFLEVADSFSAPVWRRWTEILLPGALPFIVAGIRLGIGRGLVGVIVAEFETAITGLGGVILQRSQNLQLAEGAVPAVFLAAVGIALTVGLRRLEARLNVWKR